MVAESLTPGLRNKIWHLKRFRIFAHLSDAEMERINAISQMRRLKKGEPLYLPGDARNSLYFIKTGRVKISLLSREGKEFTIDYIEPGEILGELAVVDDSPQETMAEAVEDTALCSISRAEFERLVAEKPRIAFELTKIIGLRRKKIEARLEDLAFRDVPARIAALLLRLGREHGAQRGADIPLAVPLTQGDIAKLVGSTRESVNHSLMDFRRRGLIDVSGRHIVLRDPTNLEALT